MPTPFPKKLTIQGDDLSPLGPHQNHSTCQPSKRLPGEVGGDDTSQGGDAQCGEIILAAAAPWKGESAAPPAPGTGPARLRTNRQMEFAAGTLLKAFEELLSPLGLPGTCLPTQMYKPLHQRDLATVMAMGSNPQYLCLSSDCYIFPQVLTQLCLH